MAERTDTERLDWVEAMNAEIVIWHGAFAVIWDALKREARGTRVREAIDAAMDLEGIKEQP